MLNKMSNDFNLMLLCNTAPFTLLTLFVSVWGWFSSFVSHQALVPHFRDPVHPTIYYSITILTISRRFPVTIMIKNLYIIEKKK